MKFLTNIDFIITLLIILTIIYIYAHKYQESSSRLLRTLITISAALTILIIIIINLQPFIFKDTHYSEEYSIERLKNYDYIDTENASIILIKDLVHCFPFFL
jgi:hypothetical protein